MGALASQGAAGAGIIPSPCPLCHIVLAQAPGSPAQVLPRQHPRSLPQSDPQTEDVHTRIPEALEQPAVDTQGWGHLNFELDREHWYLIEPREISAESSAYTDSDRPMLPSEAEEMLLRSVKMSPNSWTMESRDSASRVYTLRPQLTPGGPCVIIPE